jgi:hypothetical protein
MNKKLYFVTICAVVLTVIEIIGMFSPKRSATAALSLDAPEAVKIKRVIQKAYAIDVEAAASFDLSQFSSVYVNDPRGGALGVGWLKVVQNDWQQTNDSRLNNPSYTPGYLVVCKLNSAMNYLQGLTSYDSVAHPLKQAREMSNARSEARQVQIEIQG